MIAFWTGWSAMLLAVLPPLDGQAAIFFSAHMLQHELPMLVGAPLIHGARAALVEATLALESGPGKGTSVFLRRAVLPFH